MRFWLGVGAAMLTLHPVAEPVTDVWVVEVDAPFVWEPTPIADSLVDWVEVDRQEECLWTFLQASGLEVTGRNVLAAGEWADVNGGACRLIGVDGEEQG